MSRKAVGCQASRGDGECSWSECPQRKRYLSHCPLDICTCDDHDGFDHGCPLHGRDKEPKFSSSTVIGTFTAFARHATKV